MTAYRDPEPKPTRIGLHRMKHTASISMAELLRLVGAPELPTKKDGIGVKITLSSKSSYDAEREVSVSQTITFEWDE